VILLIIVIISVTRA